MKWRNVVAVLIVGSTASFGWILAQEASHRTSPDAVSAAQQSQMSAEHSQAPSMKRPEQQKNEHDRSNIFFAPNAKPSSPVFKGQAKEGKNSGFDFYRDPLNSDTPNQNPDEIMQQLMANRPKVMQAQRELLESQYDLTPKLDAEAKMSVGRSSRKCRYSSSRAWSVWTSTSTCRKHSFRSFRPLFT
jgi:hypothetical protein